MLRIDLSGQRFGRLIAVQPGRTQPVKGGTRTYWLCQCDCGKTAEVLTSNLRRGRTLSCGCLVSDTNRQRSYTGSPRRRLHGERYDSPEYRTWRGIRLRCNTPTHKDYKHYGAKGVRVCERWNTYTNFLADMGRKPGPEYSIERLNPFGDYEPSNCIWLPMAEQQKNRRRHYVARVSP